MFLHVIIHKLNFKSHSLKRFDANARKMFKILLINGCASIINNNFLNERIDHCRVVVVNVNAVGS